LLVRPDRRAQPTTAMPATAAAHPYLERPISFTMPPVSRSAVLPTTRTRRPVPERTGFRNWFGKCVAHDALTEPVAENGVSEFGGLRRWRDCERPNDVVAAR
jgi:hypothetical protein